MDELVERWKSTVLAFVICTLVTTAYQVLWMPRNKRKTEPEPDANPYRRTISVRRQVPVVIGFSGNGVGPLMAASFIKSDVITAFDDPVKYACAYGYGLDLALFYDENELDKPLIHVQHKTPRLLMSQTAKSMRGIGRHDLQQFLLKNRHEHCCVENGRQVTVVPNVVNDMQARTIRELGGIIIEIRRPKCERDVMMQEQYVDGSVTQPDNLSAEDKSTLKPFWTDVNDVVAAVMDAKYGPQQAQ